MPRWGMVIDLDRCTGCQACVVACKVENNIPTVPPEEAHKGRSIAWMEVLSMVDGTYPDVKVRYLPRPCMHRPCMHCDRPACIKVCPVRATYRNREGLVAQVYSRCIGCRYCAMACPYTVKYFNYSTHEWTAEEQRHLNPDVSVRVTGVVEKCTFCHHRLQKAREQARIEGRELKEGDYTPACVQTCPAGAMFFGDLDDTRSMVSRLSKTSRAFRLMEELGMEPKVFYLSEGEWHG